MRADFYEHDSKLRIAEFSFAPYAGMVHYEPEEFDREMGEWLDLEKEMNSIEEIQKSVEVEVGVMLVVHNMYQENFKDACFFAKCAEKCDDEFEKRKYLRAAAVFYVTCIDSWLAQTANFILNGSEDKIKDKLNDPEGKIHWTKLVEVINKKGKSRKNNGNHKINYSEEFNALRDYRNSFIHYSPAKYEKNYGIDEISRIVNNAPRAIKEFMEMLGYPDAIKIEC